MIFFKKKVQVNCSEDADAYIQWAIEDTKQVKRRCCSFFSFRSEEVDILKALQTNNYDSNPDQS